MIKLNNNFIAIVLIVLLGSVAYANSFNNGFVYDDDLVIQSRSFLSSWNNIRYLFSPLYFAGSGEYSFRPVLTLTYFFDYIRGNTSAFAFHQTNVALHILDGILLYFFLLYVIPFLDKRYKPNVLALIAALIFIVHPAQTESVDGIAFREEMLFSFFALLSLIFYIKNKIKFNYFYVAVSVIAYLLALFSKESAIAMIFVLFLVDVYYRSEQKKVQGLGLSRNNFKFNSYIGYIAVTIVYLIVRFVWMNVGGKLSAQGEILRVGGSLYASVLTSGRIMVKYLTLLLYPLRLSVEHFYYYAVNPSYSIFEPKALASFIFLGLLLIFVVRNLWKYRIFAFSVLWFFLWLTPASNIVPLNHAIAERFLYISLAGFALFLSVLIIDPFYFRQGKITAVSIKNIQVIFLVLVLAFYSFLTINRNKVWRDPLTFWEETMKSPPNSQRAYASLGYAYYENKRYDEAIAAFNESLRMRPDYASARRNLSLTYLDLGRYEEAEQQAREALRFEPDSSLNYNHLGRIFLRKNEYAKAEKEFERTLELNPFFAEAYNNLAICYFFESKYDKAIEEYEKSLKLSPGLADVYANIGLVYVAKNDLSKAEANFQKALKLNPQLVSAHNNLGVVYIRQGRHEQAKQQWGYVMKINPGDLEAKKNLEMIGI